MAGSRQGAKASMVDLKAELARKQNEYKKLKTQNAADFVKGKKTEKRGKKDPWNKKNTGVLERASLDMEKMQEEEDIMERSRKALEAKSKIYDEIASVSGIPDDDLDGSEGFLVDFQKKALDRIVEERRGNKVAPSGAQDASDDDFTNEEPIPEPKDPGEEWVDYVDTFGRSRRCMKKDLPQLETQERPAEKPTASLDGLKLKEGATLLSADMKRELRRQQWEKEVQEAANGPIHYANVQFDEIRTHGTGFYQFSKDSNLRTEQMEMLSKLREQTMDSREKSMRIKEKRKAALQVRLAKVKQRRILKEGSLLGMDAKDDDVEKTEEETPQSSTEKEPELLTRDDSWRQNAPVREWDLGKPKLPEWNAKRFMEEKRLERESEFAPPQFYYDKQNFRQAGQSGPTSRATCGRPVGKTQTAAHSSTASSTDIMLKQMRNSVGASSQALAADGKPGVQGGGVLGEEESAKGDLDPAVIPMPDEVTARPSGESGKGSDGVSQRMQPFPSAGQRQTCVRGQEMEGGAGGQGYFQGSGELGQAVDVSVPPPGWPAPSQPLGPTGQLRVMQTSAWTAEPPATDPPSQQAEATITSATLPTPFRYPSQQGMLAHPLPQLPPFKSSQPTPAPTLRPSAPPSVKPVMPMVDKRFMQNREVSDEDLLGYMASGSGLQPPTSIEAVSYTPGSFSSAEAQSHQGAEGDSRVSLDDSSPSPCQAPQDSNPTAGQTQGVIFGVPDFLQPASGVAAETYQPGSFMAAKAQAAQKAELAYEAARKKQSYSSAPVLYNQLPDSEHDGQAERESVISGNAGQGGVTLSGRDDMGDKVTNFLKSLREGK